MNELPKVEIEFGISSFLFLLPFLYACRALTNSFLLWKILLLLLTLSSYFCNRYPTNTLYQLYDHTVIIVLTMTYIVYTRNHLYLIPIILVLYSNEIVLTRRVLYTVAISFLLLHACGWVYFSTMERYLVVSLFLIGVYCKVTRIGTCHTYPYYTLVWHLCCAILLLLATISLQKTLLRSGRIPQHLL